MAQHVDAHVIRHSFFHGLLQVLIQFRFEGESRINRFVGARLVGANRN